jgi:putative peptidoglycan lipid II flippase
MMAGAFEGHGRIIGFGAPVMISALVFGTVGVLELIVTRDEIISVILKKVKR